MKKVSGAILIVLMALLVSCSMDTEDPSSRGAYVTFGQSQSVGSRSLDTSYDVVGYDELYWFYDAVKKDTYGTTGAGTGQKIPGDASGKGTAGTVGPFSQGKWEFKLYAYSSASDETGSWVAKANSLVYASEAIPVSLRGGETKNIAVSVTPKGDTGTVAFENGSEYAFFKWNDGGTDAPVVTFHLDGSKDVNDFTTEVTLGEKEESSGEYKLVGPLAVTISGVSTTAIPVDFYNCTVTVSIPGYKDTPLYTQSFSLSVFGGQTTIITGDITENVDSKVSFNVMDSELVVFQSSGSASSSVTPSGNEGATTTVDFSSANLDSGSTYYLTVGAAGSSAQNNDGFVVSDGQYVVGSIDLSLIAVSVADGTTVQTPVTSFDGEAVTVTTYIETGLPEVSLQYVGEGNAPTLISYDSTTGELKFSTTHFSTFIVVADAVALNMDTGMYYGALNTAFNEARDGDSIKLLADVEVGDANTEGAYIVILDKELRFDLAGHVITVADDYKWNGGVIEIKQGGSLTIDDSSTGQTGGINVVKEPVDFYNLVYDCVVLFPDKNSGNGASLIINGGNYRSTAYTISGNGSITENEKTYVEINGGNFYSTDSQNIYHPQIGTLVVNGGTFDALEAAIEVRAGDVTINDGSFTARRETGAYCNSNPGGDTTGGAAIAIAQHTTQFPINVVIKDGLFKGYYALHQKNVESNPQEAVDKISIEVNGGDFSTLGEGTVPVYSENFSGFINAGTFSDQIDSEYVAVTSKLAESEESWVVTPIFEGSGSESDPYQIGSVDQLKKLAELVNAGTSFQDEYFILTCNLDLANENWTPIGLSKVLDKDPYSLTKSSFNGFAGTFDGQNHTISNLMINRDSSPTIWAGSYLGLFGVVYPGATLKDFTIDNVDISGSSLLGAAVGYCPSDADSPVGTVKLSGIYVTGEVSIKGESNMGALIGRVETKVESVISDCHIVADDGSGIFSNPKTWVSNFAGGLAGSLYSTTSNVIEDVSVANLIVEGDVEGVGALCGHINHGTVSDVIISNVTAQIDSGRSTGNDRKSIGAIAGLIGGSASDSSATLLKISGTNSFKNVVIKFPIAKFTPNCHGLVGTYRTDSIDSIDPSSSVTGATSYEGIGFTFAE